MLQKEHPISKSIQLDPSPLWAFLAAHLFETFLVASDFFPHEALKLGSTLYMQSVI